MSTVRCAVIGQPVAHSLSPRLHAAFAQQFSLDLQYERIDCGAAQFAAVVAEFFRNGGCGLNVTVPHKNLAYQLAQDASHMAQLAQAANTLSVRDELLCADNTDGLGLLCDLDRLGYNLKGKNIVVMGAGGAAAGILPALLERQPGDIAVLNRSAARAQELINRIDTKHLRLFTPNSAACDVLISTVTEGFTELVANINLPSHCLIYDINYGARAQFTRDYAQAHQLRMADGMGMLIEQAAHSFALWHGLFPETGALHQGCF